MPSKEAVLEALSTVRDDRHGGRNIVEAGMVREVVIDGHSVTVRVQFDVRPVVERHALEDAISDAVEALEGVTECLVESLVPESPGAAQEPEAGHGQCHGHGHGHGHGDGHKPAPKPQPIPGVKHILAIASGKGGVGKSTVAVNLALALVERGFSVGLLDCDLYGPSAPTLLGVHRKPEAADGKLLPVEVAGLRVMSLGFLLDDDAPVIWRGPIVMGIVRQFLQDVNWEGTDFLVVDLPPGTGDTQLTLVQTVPISGAVIVTTPSDLALTDAVRGLRMFERVDVPVFGLVENMSHFVCTHCGERSDVFGAGAVRRTAEEMGLPFLAEIPLDAAVRQGGDTGSPVVVQDPGSPLAAPFFALADALIERCGVAPA